jgi:hypothetical protein
MDKTTPTSSKSAKKTTPKSAKKATPKSSRTAKKPKLDEDSDDE